MATMHDMITAGLDGISRDRDRMDRIHRYLTGKHDDPYMPPSASTEYRLLAERSRANWIPLLVKTPAQTLSVTGYRTAGKGDEAPPEWRAWQRNRMDARQTAVHRAALTYGLSFVVVTRGDDGDPLMRAVSPRLMYAAYADPAGDDLPLWALEVERRPEKGTTEDPYTAILYTQTQVIHLVVSDAGEPTFSVTRSYPHGMQLKGRPVCPVVRFAPDIDLEGCVTGVVEPMIPIQDRINQTTFDRLVAQTFGSFKVRTVSGMAPELERDPDTGEIVYGPDGRPKPVPIRADASRFLMTPNDSAKFGTLDETPLDGFLDAVTSDIKQLAAVSQTPPHYLLGDMVNLSAEALAAAEAALTRSVQEMQRPLGESWELVLALAGSAMGRDVDDTAQVTWDDFESRSFSQIVDALGKAAQMLHIPVRALWSRIPGVTDADVEAWADMAEAEDPALRMADRMAQLSTPEVPRGDQTIERAV